MKKETQKISDTIVQSRALINGIHEISIDAQRVLHLGLSKVNSKLPCPGRIHLTTSDYRIAYDGNSGHAMRSLRKGLKDLMDEKVKFNHTGEDGEDCVLEAHWLDAIDYPNCDTGSNVYLSFSQHIIPELFELESKFVQIPLNDAARIQSPFAFRLYQNLLQYETDPSKRDGDCFVVELTMEQIFNMCPSKDPLSPWKEVNRKLISPAIEKMNAVDRYFFSYKPIKRGKSVGFVEFRCVDLKSQKSAPVRPKLVRRTIAAKASGSQAEFDWAETNRNALIDYCASVFNYFGGDMGSVRMEDLDKISELSLIVKKPIPTFIEDQLIDRKRKISKFLRK